MLSNSDTPLVRELYRDFRVDTMIARRAINSASGKRGPITEVVVVNY
jgi:DNA adenine methylase